jgi:transposase
LTTKIHALVDALGNPANLILTAGQIHDLACAQDLIENADPEALIADKAYDADPLINSLTEREITPVIPVPTANPKQLSIACESVDNHGDGRSPRVDLVRRGRAVPIARSLANRSSRPSASAQCAEA